MPQNGLTLSEVLRTLQELGDQHLSSMFGKAIAQPVSDARRGYGGLAGIDPNELMRDINGG